MSINSNARQVNVIKKVLTGDYIVIPGQNILLDNAIIKISSTEFKIFIKSIHNQLLDYKIRDTQISQYDSEYLYNMEIRLETVNKYNMKVYDEVDNLLTNIFKLTPPTTIHLSYNVKDDIFILKNNSFKTIVMLKKIK